MRFAAIGDNCVDIYVNLRKVCPGGGCVNFAVQANRVGIPSSYIGAIGTDEFGKFIRTSMKEEGVDLTHLQTLEGKTGYALVELHGAERVFIGSDHGIRDNFIVDEKVQEFLYSHDLIHTTLDGKVDSLIPLWKENRKKVSYDFSHRATPGQISMLPFIYTGFFSGQKFSLDEGKRYLKKIYTPGPEVIVMTFGEKGSIAYDGSKLHYQPEFAPIKPVDTLGAGDTFQAGFMAAYMSGKNIEESLFAGANLTKRTLSELGGFGRARSLDQFDQHIF